MLTRFGVALGFVSMLTMAQGQDAARDASARQAPKEGAMRAPGVEAAAVDYVQPGTENSDYPLQAPFVFAQGAEGRFGYGDNVLTMQVNLILGSAFETALLGSAGSNNTNLQADTVTVQTHGPIQIGGVRSTVVDHNGTDDLVMETTVANATGSDRGDNEGLERHRDFYGFQNARFGGAVTLLGPDAVGHERMRVAQTASYDLSVAAGGRWLIDLSKRLAPAGDAVLVNRYSDSRFAVVEMDAQLTASVHAKLGGNAIITHLTGGADVERYDARCPATREGGWGETDPYNADWAGNGAKTRSQCLSVESTAGLADGMSIGLWGSQNNAEITQIKRVVDAKHLLVPLNHPHQGGELVTAGAGVGWALGSPRSEYPAGFLPDAASRQAMVQHAAYPVIAVTEHSILLFTNSGATQEQAELHLNLFESNTPRGGLVFKPEVRGGKVVSLGWSGGNGAGGDYSTRLPYVPGVLPVLPPPVLEIGRGCRIPPTVRLVQTSSFQYRPDLVSGGEGCPVSLTIKAQDSYENHVVLYPVTKIYRTEDPDHDCTLHGVRLPHCPVSGYLLTDVLATRWTSGDVVEQVPGWNQFSGSQENIVGSPDVMRSGQIGPGELRRVWYPQNSQPLTYLVNATPSSVYFGRKENGYQRTGKEDPTEAYDAQQTPPTVVEYGNTWSGGQLFDAPPMAGEGTAGGGWITMVVCKTTAFSGPGQDLPCARGVRPDYDIFVHDMREVGGTYLKLTVSDADQCLKINGKCIVTK